jgi:hypothetical protein
MDWCYKVTDDPLFLVGVAWTGRLHLTRTGVDQSLCNTGPGYTYQEQGFISHFVTPVQATPTKNRGSSVTL